MAPFGDFVDLGARRYSPAADYAAAGQTSADPIISAGPKVSGLEHPFDGAKIVTRSAAQGAHRSGPSLRLSAAALQSSLQSSLLQVFQLQSSQLQAPQDHDTSRILNTAREGFPAVYAHLHKSTCPHH